MRNCRCAHNLGFGSTPTDTRTSALSRQDGTETWTPSKTGGFLYYRYYDPPVFFPCDPRPPSLYSSVAHAYEENMRQVGASFAYVQDQFSSMLGSMFGFGMARPTNRSKQTTVINKTAPKVEDMSN